MNPPPLSPCNRICTLDDVLDLCVGCGRTREEIAAWPAMDDPTRRDIMAQLPARMAAAEAADHEEPRRKGPERQC